MRFVLLVTMIPITLLVSAFNLHIPGRLVEPLVSSGWDIPFCSSGKVGNYIRVSLEGKNLLRLLGVGNWRSEAGKTQIARKSLHDC